MAQRSMRRDRDNQLINQCREHVCLIWTRSADSHPGPRPVSRMTGRTHGSPDHALDQTEDFSCVTRGVYTWLIMPMYYREYILRCPLYCINLAHSPQRSATLLVGEVSSAISPPV
jgi:hypothetical protein